MNDVAEQHPVWFTLIRAVDFNERNERNVAVSSLNSILLQLLFKDTGFILMVMSRLRTAFHSNRIGGHATAQRERSEDTYCTVQEHC